MTSRPNQSSHYSRRMFIKTKLSVMAVARLFAFVLVSCSSLGGLAKAQFPRSFLEIPLLSQFLVSWWCEIDNELNIF